MRPPRKTDTLIMYPSDSLYEMVHHHNSTRTTREPPAAPTPDRIQHALDELVTHEVPGTPPVSALKTLEQASIRPTLEIYNRTVKDWKVTSGNPGHGAMRTDDHVGRFEVIHRKDCPDCHSQHAVYKYRAHHNIAGGMSHTCQLCDYEHDGEEWG